MQRYLISFDDGAMDHIAQADLPEVAVASRTVVQEAKDADVWVFGGGLHRQQGTVVDVDGAVSPGPAPESKAAIGGFAIVEVASRDDAVQWARRLARACRCPQEIREIMYDPDS